MERTLGGVKKTEQTTALHYTEFAEGESPKVGHLVYSSLELYISICYVIQIFLTGDINLLTTGCSITQCFDYGVCAKWFHSERSTIL